MAGSKTFRKIQMGRETTAGTAVAATTIWRGGGTIEDQRQLNFVEEDIGYIGGADHTNTSKLLGALAMDDTAATFEQLPYLLTAGIKAQTTGTSDGVGSGKIYTYTAPTTAKNTITTYTLQGGDDEEAERMEYSYVDNFMLKGSGPEMIMMAAEWYGRQVAVNAFTGSLTLPTIEDMLFLKSKLYIDAIGGTIGTTQATNTFMGFELKVKTGWVPVFTGDGNLYFSFAKSTGALEVLLSVTFEHDSVGRARKVDWRAETARLIRIDVTGNALTTPGTLYSNKKCIIDMAAKVEKVSKLDEIDGNDVLQVDFRARFNQTANRFFEIVVVNENATLV